MRAIYRNTQSHRIPLFETVRSPVSTVDVSVQVLAPTLKPATPDPGAGTSAGGGVGASVLQVHGWVVPASALPPRGDSAQ